MRFLVDNPLQVGHLVTRARAQDYMLTIIYVARARLDINGACPLLGMDDQPGLQPARAYDDGLGNSPIFSGDFVPFKPKTDLTLYGAAYAPNRGKTTKLRVTLGVGQWRKSLTIIGDRDWHRSGTLELSEPRPFARMPLRLEHAFGGLDSAYNPWGKGFGAVADTAGSTLPACNIHPADTLHTTWDKDILPAAFGPLSPDMQPRVTQRGTYDKAWLYKRNPLPPLDFDWAFHNAAPPDQQFHPYLRGDEVLFFENLNPLHAIFESRLPGLRPRIVLQRRMPGNPGPQFEEPPARLDSLHIDAESMTVDLAWRAVISTPDPEAGDVTLCYIAREPIDAPQPLARHVEAILAETTPPPAPLAPLPAPPLVQDEEDPEYRAHMQHLRDLIQRMPLQPEAKQKIMAAVNPDEMEKLLMAEVDKISKTTEKMLAGQS